MTTWTPTTTSPTPVPTYVITPSVSGGVGGSIDPNTPQTVNYGDTPTFTFSPDTVYSLGTVTVDGSPVILRVTVTRSPR